MNDSITTSDVKLKYCNLDIIECEKCEGTGFQQRTDGIWVVCPICEGSGTRRTYIRCPPVQPWYPYNPLDNLPSYSEQKYVITC